MADPGGTRGVPYRGRHASTEAGHAENTRSPSQTIHKSHQISIKELTKKHLEHVVTKKRIICKINPAKVHKHTFNV